MSTVGRPREHDERTASALLAAADALLATGGADAVSVRAVADAVGTTTRAVYSVFGSKDGLLLALCRLAYERLTALVEAAPDDGDPATALVAAGVDGFRPFALGSPHLFRLSFERVPPSFSYDADVVTARIGSYHALAARIAGAADAGLLGDRSVEQVAFQFHSLCQGLASTELQRPRPPDGPGLWAFVPPRLDGAALWRDALGALVRGFTAPVGGAPGTRRAGTSTR